MTYEHVGLIPILAILTGFILSSLIPLGLAIFWTVKKKENFGTIVVGAAAFFLFAIIIEKLIQNALLFPTYMGLKDNAVSIYCNAHPLLLAFLVGLFPGVFEETGRLIAYKTILKKRRNRETSISYGIGHGGFEVMFMIGASYMAYLYYAFMLNTDTYAQMVAYSAAKAPESVETLNTIATTISSFSFATLGLVFFERIFAVMFHIGASMLVFYACKDAKKFWLYPLAIALHTVIDFTAGMVMFNVINISEWGVELVLVVAGLLTFFGAYLLLYKKDVTVPPADAAPDTPADQTV